MKNYTWILTFILSTFHFLLLVKADVLIVCLLALIIYWIIKIYYQIKTYTDTYTFLEITPLDMTAQMPLSTQEFIKILHAHALPDRHFFLFFQKKVYSLEISATKYHGIRYILRVPLTDADIIKK